jgi:uncharacterized paraquat-inducible protein A
MTKHIHKYQRMKQGQKGHKIFKCVDCKHYLPHISIALARTARCWRCGHAFTMGKYQLTLAKPHCNDCIRTKHSADVNKLASLFSDD